MAENKKSCKYYMDLIKNITYGFNDKYGLCFLTPVRFNIVSESLSSLRRSKDISGETYHALYSIMCHHAKNYHKINELISQEPRCHAQRFISKKNIRNFIFKRDGYICLKCGSNDNLTIDHIVPIHYGGVNRIYNLQTLCRSCNSSKSTQIEDYREGAR